MKNFVQPGDTLTVDTPAGGALSGAGVLVGSIFGVAAYTSPAGAPLEVVTEGVFDLDKEIGDPFAAGDKVYWNAADKKATSTAGGHAWIGVATNAAIASTPSVRVRLNHMPIV